MLSFLRCFPILHGDKTLLLYPLDKIHLKYQVSCILPQEPWDSERCVSGWHGFSHVQSDAQAPGGLQGLTVSAGMLWMGPVETKEIYSGTILLCLEQAFTVWCEWALDTAVNSS